MSRTRSPAGPRSRRCRPTSSPTAKKAPTGLPGLLVRPPTHVSGRKAALSPSLLAGPYTSRTVAAPRPEFRLSPGPDLFRVVLEAGEQEMVLPRAVDAQVLARIALAGKAAALEQADRRGVGRDAGRLDAVQPQRAEGEGQDRLHGRRHVAGAHIGLAHPVADAAGLRDAAPDARQGEAADQHVVLAAEDEERIGLVGAPILSIALEAAPERAAGEIIGQIGRA